jgi:WD40 repeat protein
MIYFINLTPQQARRKVKARTPFNVRHSNLISSILGCLLLSHPAFSQAKPLQVLTRLSTNWDERIYCLAFSPDGQVLAVGSSAPASGRGLAEGTIELWDLRTGQLSNTLRQSARTQFGSDQSDSVGSISFSPDGKWVVGTDAPGYTLWDLATGKQKFRWFKAIGDPELSVGWSSDGRVLALPSMERVRFDSVSGTAVIDIPSGTRTAFFPVEIGYAHSARISPDGKLLAAAGFDCMVKVFDLAAQTNIFTDSLGLGPIWAACFSPDGRHLVAGSEGGMLLIYDITSEGGKINVNKNGKSATGVVGLHEVEFTPDGKRAFSQFYGFVALWDSTSWTNVKTLQGCQGRLSPDGTRVALVKKQSPTVSHTEKSPDLIEIWDLDELAKTMLLPAVKAAPQFPRIPSND